MYFMGDDLDFSVGQFVVLDPPDCLVMLEPKLSVI